MVRTPVAGRSVAVVAVAVVVAAAVAAAALGRRRRVPQCCSELGTTGGGGRIRNILLSPHYRSTGQDTGLHVLVKIQGYMMAQIVEEIRAPDRAVEQGDGAV